MRKWLKKHHQKSIKFVLKTFQCVIKTFLERFPFFLVDFDNKYLIMAYMTQNVTCDNLFVPDFFQKSNAEFYKSYFYPYNL